MPGFLCGGLRNPNQGPYGGTASTLLTEPSPQVLGKLLIVCHSFSVKQEGDKNILEKFTLISLIYLLLI